MLLFLKQIAIAALVSLILGIMTYFLVRDISLYPRRIDTGVTNIFGTDTRNIVYGRDVLNPEKKNVLIVGASNVREGFRPDELKAVLPEYDVHNLSVAASNITQIKQVVDLLREHPFRRGWPDQIIVIGIWYGLFVGDSHRWRENHLTDIGLEQLRYRVYTRDSSTFGSRRRIPKLLVGPFLTIVKASNLLASYMSVFHQSLFDFLDGRERRAHDASAAGKSFFDILRGPYRFGWVDEETQSKAIKGWQDYVNGQAVDRDQSELLSTLLKDLEAQGAKIVLVDMPLPKWHQEKSAFFKQYERDRQSIYGVDGRARNVRYVNLLDLNDESFFYDSAHPTADAAVVWSKRLDAELRKI